MSKVSIVYMIPKIKIPKDIKLNNFAFFAADSAPSKSPKSYFFFTKVAKYIAIPPSTPFIQHTIGHIDF